MTICSRLRNLFLCEAVLLTSTAFGVATWGQSSQTPATSQDPQTPKSGRTFSAPAARYPKIADRPRSTERAVTETVLNGLTIRIRDTGCALWECACRSLFCFRQRRNSQEFPAQLQPCATQQISVSDPALFLTGIRPIPRAQLRSTRNTRRSA
jgi:hypothetical protein